MSDLIPWVSTLRTGTVDGGYPASVIAVVSTFTADGSGVIPAWIVKDFPKDMIMNLSGYMGKSQFIPGEIAPSSDLVIPIYDIDGGLIASTTLSAQGFIIPHDGLAIPLAGGFIIGPITGNTVAGATGTIVTLVSK